jgi:hypothetical protein
MLAAGAAHAQAPTTALGDELQAFASRPTAHAGWTREIGRIDAEGTHAVISAIEMEDATQQRRSVRGVRIDLMDATGEERLYIDEQRLAPNIGALDEIANESPRFLARSPAGNHMRCFGSRYFWMRATGDFSASECQTGSGPFLEVRGTRDFQFHGLEPESFRNLLVRASEQIVGR